MNPLLSVVVPVYRNADTVRALADGIGRVCQASGISFEIVFVEDACPEGSLAVLKPLARDNPHVSVLALDRNHGQHLAVLTGLSYARGEWIVIMDADLQDPVEALPTLLEKGRAGYQAVFAGRRGHYESSLRLFTSRLFKRTMHTLIGLPADAGIFCLLSRDLARQLVAMNDGRPSIVAMIGCAGRPMISVPVTRAPRPSGQSAYDTRRRLRSAWRAIRWALRWRLRETLRSTPSPTVPLPSCTGYDHQEKPQP